MPRTMGHSPKGRQCPTTKLSPQQPYEDPHQRESQGSYRPEVLHIRSGHKLRGKAEIYVSTGFKAGNGPGSGRTALQSPTQP